MGLGSEAAVESAIQQLCGSLEKKIKANRNHPEVVRVLKQIGLEQLGTLNYIPAWADQYLRLFRG